MMPSLVMHAKDYSWGGGKDTDATDEATGAEEYHVSRRNPRTEQNCNFYLEERQNLGSFIYLINVVGQISRYRLE